MTKTYVAYITPNVMVNDETTKEVLDRNAQREAANRPKNTIGFYYFDREETFLNGETLVGKPKNKGILYGFGTEMTLEAVKRDPSSTKALIGNMESNKWSRVLRTRNGTYPLHDGDIVVGV